MTSRDDDAPTLIFVPRRRVVDEAPTVAPPASQPARVPDEVPARERFLAMLLVATLAAMAGSALGSALVRGARHEAAPVRRSAPPGVQKPASGKGWTPPRD